MSSITSIENLFTNNLQIAKNPQFPLLVDQYTQELAAGYDPDTSLLTDMFVVLSDLVVDDPALAADIDVLEIAIVEEVFVRDPDLGSNPELSTMLKVYGGALESGYEPPEETTDAILAALSGVETTDPVLSDLIGSVISELTPVPDMPETFGFVLKGIDASDSSGYSVSSAGDVNGDGIDDILIGAHGADPDGVSGAGETYVVFGRDGGFAPSLDLETLDGNDGFVLNGIHAYDRSGWSVSSAGDVNGDGIDDILTLDGNDGFVLNGIDAGDSSGRSVSSAGDVNGDGIDDILIGAWSADPYGLTSAGETYVVFGKDTTTAGDFTATLDLETLDGTAGFVLNGIDASDTSGFSVSSAGDVNGDGIDDILIGAHNADPEGVTDAGVIYVVFGKDTATAGAFDASLGLETLDGSNGFVLKGIDASDSSGYSVSSAGDVNGDGIDDILIGAPRADPDGLLAAGETYVVFGKDTATEGDFATSLDLETLDGTNGFVFRGIDTLDQSGVSVSSAGDVNGDGIDDILIGAIVADPNGVDGAGETYVIYGGEEVLSRFDYADGISDGSIDLALIGLNPAEYDFFA